MSRGWMKIVFKGKGSRGVGRRRWRAYKQAGKNEPHFLQYLNSADVPKLRYQRLFSVQHLGNNSKATASCIKFHSIGAPIIVSYTWKRCEECYIQCTCNYLAYVAEQLLRIQKILWSKPWWTWVAWCMWTLMLRCPLMRSQ